MSWLGVRGVGGNGHAGDVESVEQSGDLGDFGGVGRDFHLRDDHGGVVAHRGEQLHVKTGAGAGAGVADGLAVQGQSATGVLVEQGGQPGADQPVHDCGVDGLGQPAQGVARWWDADTQDGVPAGSRGVEHGLREFRDSVRRLPEVTCPAQQCHGQDCQHRSEGMPDTFRLARVLDLREHCGQGGDPPQDGLPGGFRDDIDDRVRD